MADPSVLGGIESALKTHTLLRVRGPQALRSEAGPELPVWVEETLRRTPWVVVRRAPSSAGLIPVGVRGESRQQRFASWVEADAVLQSVTPQALASGRAWATAVGSARRAAIPALAALGLVETVMDEQGLGHMWGPAGSVGFELASGRATATARSDLDLVVEITGPGAQRFDSVIDRLVSLPGALGAALASSVRVDVLLETTEGAVALSEYARSRETGGPFVLRTAHGPLLTRTLGPTVGLRA